MEISKRRIKLFLISMCFVILFWTFSALAVMVTCNRIITGIYVSGSGISIVIALESIIFQKKPKRVDKT